MDRMLNVLRETTERDFKKSQSQRTSHPDGLGVMNSKYTTASGVQSSHYHRSPTRGPSSGVTHSPTRQPSATATSGLGPMTVEDFKLMREEYRYRLPSSQVDRKGFVRHSSTLQGLPAAVNAAVASSFAQNGAPQSTPRVSQTTEPVDDARHKLLLRQIAGGQSGISPLLKSNVDARHSSDLRRGPSPPAGTGDRRIQEWSEHVLKYHPLAGKYAQSTSATHNNDMGSPAASIFSFSAGCQQSAVMLAVLLQMLISMPQGLAAGFTPLNFSMPALGISLQGTSYVNSQVNINGYLTTAMFPLLCHLDVVKSYSYPNLDHERDVAILSTWQLHATCNPTNQPWSDDVDHDVPLESVVVEHEPISPSPAPIHVAAPLVGTCPLF